MKDRKADHISLALSSQVMAARRDPRFFYEPLTGVTPGSDWPPIGFCGKQLRAPIWVSSMTGGTEKAARINNNLARVCNEFGLGMGLGSCRILLENRKYFDDFNVRPVIGDDLPLFANIGIAQLEQILEEGKAEVLAGLVGDLQADGLIIHVNPIQEWLQKEGDRIKRPPILSIIEFLELTAINVIVKEVGQGMGPDSLARLLSLPLAAIEFGAFGGTNFASVEIARKPETVVVTDTAYTSMGHTAEEMLQWANQVAETSGNVRCRQLIISGGISGFLDGYYMISASKLPAVYGQASGFLRYADGEYTHLKAYVAAQIEGLLFARNYLHIKQ